MESLLAQFGRPRSKTRWFWYAQNDKADFRHRRFAEHALRSDDYRREIDVSRRCDALRYVCGTGAATVPSHKMEISYRRSRDFVMFSSPAVAGDVVFIGVLSATLEARDKNWRAALGFSDGEVQAKQRLGVYRRSKVQSALSDRGNLLFAARG